MKRLVFLGAILLGQVGHSVEVHTGGFLSQPAGSGDHFWMKIENWKAWSESSMQDSLELPGDLVLAAKDKCMPYVEPEDEENPLPLADIKSVLEGTEANALDFFVRKRTEKYEEGDYDEDDCSPGSWSKYYKGAVMSSKVQIDISKDVNLATIDESQVMGFLGSADQPHIHKEVSKEWAHKFIEPIHLGHQKIDELSSSGKVILGIVNTSKEHYQCWEMNQTLGLYGSIAGVVTYKDRQFRLYLLNTIEEVDGATVPGIVESGAVKVYKQETIYSSAIIKSAVSYVAFYEEGGRKKIIVSTVMNLTDRLLGLKTGVNLAVNGYTDKTKNLRGLNISESEDLKLVSISGDQIELRRTEPGKTCSKGLTKGFANYIYQLAYKISEEL